MEPEVGVRNPVIRLNSVVLPAPFGPMRQVILIFESKTLLKT